MREILFKGKRLDTKEWIIGDLIHRFDFSQQLPEYGNLSIKQIGGEEYSIIPETLCEFTGRLDSNKNKIFENDSITWMCKGSHITGTVYYSSYGWWIKDERGGNTTQLYKASSVVVIGSKV